MLISGVNLNKSFGDKVLLKNASFSISQGEKLGLIGRNGQGKTTLLNIIYGKDVLDSGEINKISNLNIGYLSQNSDFQEDNTILEQVFNIDNEINKLIKTYEDLINQKNFDERKLMDLNNKMDKLDAWSIERKAKTILNKLGFEDYNKKIKLLSGGEKRRVALGAALINPVDLLILDEPTNHLDNDTIEWLEEYLKNEDQNLLLVTHDRYFLDRITNRIIELDGGQIYSYDGNYEYYLEKKLEREEILLAEERKRKSLFKQELAWMQQGIRARGTRQKARVERFEELKHSKLSQEKKDIDAEFLGSRLGNKIMEIKNISKSFDSLNIVDNFSYTVLREDRIGILGDNGAGKSTFVKLLSNKLDLDSGNIDVGETVKIGYFSQDSINIEEDLRAIEFIKLEGEFIETASGDKITASQMMENFLFNGKEQWTYIKDLSGGERRRLQLLKVLMSNPNFLILDEPTNDLDLETLNVLENYIDNFKGPVLIVSHDRYFLDRLVDKIFYISNGEITYKNGNYTDFLNFKEQEEEKNQAYTNESKGTDSNYKNRDLKFSYNEKREWDTIDSDISDLEKNISSLELDMLEHATNYEKLEELMESKAKYEKLLDEKMNRWVYLSELKEKIDNQ